MWQRFTERARRVVFYAQEEAQRFGNPYVSTEHLLLGLIREEDSLGPIILVKLGISPRRLKTNVESQIQRGDSNAPQDMTLTPRAKRVIDCAFDEARNLDNNYIGTEHLLLGLIREGDGIAAKTLVPLGATLNDVRRVLIELHSRWRKRRAQS